ncbi:MAG: DUF362 domain-containing protein [Candidatus Scalindua sp. AMX11]|nr:MAG: DUF362 domain-containing protein [Candidatus Scalindua sp.]NOG85711.1 DUF362 domain-containing protein [Planctomycetota bacterium]RZV73161.1 MAG: DUF362 domain-containing protein [Candidatus Scalindua sp. SCAELEC01]TDE64750.1 MAG: DUF362 domain-containing protein [Candidatus Scalindua sp. AMX11]GJQ58686.1 MAG: hypothetical protein SCALA701_14870 [Candidatus Scalindua sp.]
MDKFTTRREFMKGLYTSTLLGGVLPQIPLPPDLIKDDSAHDLGEAIKADPLSLVVDVKSKNRIVKNLTPDIVIVKQMLNAGMTALTQTQTPEKAWRTLFSEDERIGIKINGLGSDTLIGNFQICWAIVDALKAIGVRENNIIVWDQFQHHLLSSGFRLNTSFKGVKVFATDRGEGSEALDSGSSLKEYDSGYGAVRVSNILTQEVDSLINLCLLKDHGLAGVSVALKNISHGVISHPDNFHDDACDPFIAALNSIPVIKDKIKLHICNGIRGLYEGGPMPKKRFVWDYGGIMLSKDPVAMDTIGMDIIEEKRREKNLPSLFNRANVPKHIETAAIYGLGMSNRELIDHKSILI